MKLNVRITLKNSDGSMWTSGLSKTCLVRVSRAVERAAAQQYDQHLAALALSLLA